MLSNLQFTATLISAEQSHFLIFVNNSCNKTRFYDYEHIWIQFSILQKCAQKKIMRLNPSFQILKPLVSECYLTESFAIGIKIKTTSNPHRNTLQSI